MNKVKITALITVMCVMSVNFPALSAQTVKIKPNPKIYKNALENNKAKYINKQHGRGIPHFGWVSVRCF